MSGAKRADHEGQETDQPEDSPVGTWDLTITTPIGRQAVTLALHRDAHGTLGGSATGKTETVPLTNVVRDGRQLSWDQSITRPMRLNLHFEVTTSGEQMTGTSKAGRLPASHVSGRRTSTPR